MDEVKEWILHFKWTREGYETEVDDEVRQLLESHPYLGLSSRNGPALQFYTQEQVEQLNEKLAALWRKNGLPQAQATARYLISRLTEVDLSDGQPLLIPHSLASVIRMDAWKVAMGRMTEKDGIVLLEDSEFEF